MDEDLKGYMEWITHAEILDADQEGLGTQNRYFLDSVGADFPWPLGFHCITIIYIVSVLSFCSWQIASKTGNLWQFMLFLSTGLLPLKDSDSETDSLYKKEGLNRVVYY